MLHRSVVDSPVGRLTLVGSDAGLRALLWPVERAGRVVFDEPIRDAGHPILDRTAKQVEEYFGGRRRRFDVPLDPVGTAFQQMVWRALSKIDFGETSTYGQLAKSIGKPRASRAVGAATGRNPISIVVPCHRLVGANGSLTGFAGGIEAKRWLLDHEGGGQVFERPPGPDPTP